MPQSDPSAWLDIVLTVLAGSTLLIGLVLLFLGIKLVRVLLTLLFAALGATAGLLAAQLWAPHLTWAISIGGAVAVALLGFLLFRIWIIVAFGTAVAIAGAFGWYSIMAGQDIEALRGETTAFWQPYYDLAIDIRQAGSQRMSREAYEALRLTERTKELAEGLHARYDRWSQATESVLRRNAVGGAISAAVGLAVGLLIAGLNWRLGAVLLTASWGLLHALIGLAGLAALHSPGTLLWVQQMGSRAWLLPAGLLLMGISVQGLLARKPKPATPPPQATVGAK